MSHFYFISYKYISFVISNPKKLPYYTHIRLYNILLEHWKKRRNFILFPFFLDVFFSSFFFSNTINDNSFAELLTDMQFILPKLYQLFNFYFFYFFLVCICVCIRYYSNKSSFFYLPCFVFLSVRYIHIYQVFFFFSCSKTCTYKCVLYKIKMKKKKKKTIIMSFSF